MDTLKQHPFEAEVDRVVIDLGGDLETMKHVTDTGTSYSFNFDDIPTYIALPTYVPSRPQNLVRVECEIGTVDAKEVGRILFAITQDFDISRHHPVRVVPRTKDEKSYAVLLQFVCPVDLMQVGFIAQTILYSADLAGFYRNAILIQGAIAS